MTFVTAAAIVGGAALLGTGATLYSQSKTNKILNKQADAATSQTELAQQLLGESAPLRGLTQEQLYHYLATGGIPQGLESTQGYDYGLSGYLMGGREMPTTLEPAERPSVPDLTAANRDVLESQFGRAREQAISGAPAIGGGLSSSLTDLEGKRALGVTSLYTDQNRLQYEQDMQQAQSADALNLKLFGLGVDLDREKVAQDQQLRGSLFKQAIGAGAQDVSGATANFGNAGNTFGNLASSTLKQGEDLGSIAGLPLGFALRKYFTNPAASETGGASFGGYGATGLSGGGVNVIT